MPPPELKNLLAKLKRDVSKGTISPDQLEAIQQILEEKYPYETEMLTEIEQMIARELETSTAAEEALSQLEQQQLEQEQLAAEQEQRKKEGYGTHLDTARLKPGVHLAAVKRIIWIVIICAVIGYFGNNYLQKRAREKAQREETQQIKREIRSKISQMVTTTNAVDDWVQKLSKGKGVWIDRIMTIELEKLWMGERPILFTGSIEDISSFDEQNYNLHLDGGLFSSSKTMFMTELSLKLKCNKLIVDNFLQEHPDLLSNDVVYNGVAVIANIDKIATKFIPEEGERKVLKIGIGECIDIAYIGRVTF